MTALGTKDILLKEAEALMRTRGYAAFSYADLSSRVGIRKASIHHHFPTKEKLGGSLIDGYLIKFETALQEILDEEPHAVERLRRYAEFFTASMAGGMLPLCGALSAEMSALPQSLQERVRHFFELHLSWLRGVIEAGVGAGDLRAGTDVEDTATVMLSALEGASLVAWATGDAKAITRTVDYVIGSFERGASG